MKKPSDDLFRIIKSLSPSEKRYFKVITSQRESGKASAYHALFDAIDAQDNYDEAALLANNSDGKYTKNLPMAKIYLQESILKGLCTFHAGPADEINIEEKIKEATLLMNRGLVDISDKLLKQAERLATKHENTLAKVRLARQRMADLHFRAGDGIESELKDLYDLQTKSLDQLKQEADISWLHSLTHARLNNSSLARSESERAAVQEILDHEIAQRDPYSLPTAALQYMLFNIRSRCQMVLGDYQDAFESARECVKLWESSNLGDGRPLNSGRTLHNYAVRCLRAGQLDELSVTIEKLKALSGNDLAMRKFRLESIATLEINLLALQSRYDELIKRIPSLVSELEDMKAHIASNQLMTMYYNFVTASIIAGNFSDALKYANVILNDEPFVPDAYNIVKLMELVIYTELGHFDVLPNLLRSTRRFLKKRDRIFAVEDVLLRRLAKVPDIAGTALEPEFYAKLAQEMLDAAASRPGTRIFEYFDFSVWALSKSKGVLMVDYLQRQRDSG